MFCISWTMFPARYETKCASEWSAHMLHTVSCFVLLLVVMTLYMAEITKSYRSMGTNFSNWTWWIHAHCVVAAIKILIPQHPSSQWPWCWCEECD
jgi:hypothetical protein